MPTADEQVIVDGQRALAVSEVSGDFIYDGGATDIYCIVQKDGKAQRALKVANVGEGGGGGGDIPDNVYTQDNLVAGTNISITAVPQPVIDANTLGVWHLDSSADNVVGDATITLALTPADYNTTSYKFGTASARFYQSSSAQFFSNYSTVFQNDFTLDLWARTRSNNGSDAEIIFGAGYGGSSCAFSVRSTYIDVKIGSSTPRTNTVSQSWHHIAIVRSNGVLYAFLDGVLQGTTNAPGTDNYISLYSPSNNDAEILLDEIRVSNVARWTSDFTPFSQPYQEASGNPVYQINNTQDLSSYLQNTATGSNSVTILGTATTKVSAVNVGQSSRAVGASSVAVGHNAMAGVNSIAIGPNVASGTNNHKYCIAINGSAGYGDYSVAIGGQAFSEKNVVLGNNATANRTGSIAIGYGAVVGDFVTHNTGEHSIQIGKGTTLEPYTLSIGFDGTNYKLLDGTTGLIPPERLGTGYDATKTQVLKHVNGVLTWVDEA